MADVTPTSIPEDVKARFWAKVDKRGPDDCWHWLGSNDGSYGQFWLFGKRVRATRLSLAMATGEPIDNPKLACHTCDNPPCVNPAHLWWGTMSDNIKDAIAKGRCGISKMQARQHNRIRTECRRGHPLAGDNLTIRKNGKRLCRTCHLGNQRKYDERPDIKAKRADQQRARAAARAAFTERQP